MKKLNYLVLLLSALALTLPGCVQPSSPKTVVYLLDVRGHGPVRSVGLRGRDKPLNWDYDQPLVLLGGPDSLYRVAVTTLTGYRATEVKFTLNGEYELKDQPNRRVAFSPAGDTARYRARFGVVVP